MTNLVSRVFPRVYYITVFHMIIQSSQVAAMSILKSFEKQRQMLQHKEIPELIESSSKSQVSGKIPFVLKHYEITIVFASLRTLFT